jgi:Meiotically up-regulated gene 113
MKEQILAEIRRLAAEAGGTPPGEKRFSRETGLTWNGIYWARWSDALKEAGFEPHPPPEATRIADDLLMDQLAKACRHFGRVPTVSELRLYRRANSDFPSSKTVERRFDGFKLVGPAMRAWALERPDYTDVALMLASGGKRAIQPTRGPDGSVYLLKSGDHYKIGRSGELEKRVKSIRVALPEAASLVHEIKTDDPPGIEAYWHRRFDDRRANGEWFKLSREDVAAFKRRKFQ